MKNNKSRRLFLSQLAAQAALFSVSSLAMRARAIEGPGTENIIDWVSRIERISADLRIGEVSPYEWQHELNSILSEVSLYDILKLIDFETVAKNTPFADSGVATGRVRLPEIDGVTRTVYTKLFAVGDRRAIIPHGHIGMASGYLVLEGKFRLRQYDRIAIEDSNWIVKPTIDRIESAGSLSTITDEENNVHWLIAEGDSYTLDFIMSPAVEGDNWTIQNLDIDASEKYEGDKLRVPTMDVKEALAKYGVAS